MTPHELFINSILIVILFFLVKSMASDDERRLEAEERKREDIKNSNYKYGTTTLDPMAEEATWRTGSGYRYYDKMEEEKKASATASAQATGGNTTKDTNLYCNFWSKITILLI